MKDGFKVPLLKALPKVFVVLSLLTLVAIFQTGPVLAQTTTTGSVAGTITDPSGASVPNAKVTLKDTGRGATQDTTSNQLGAFRFDLLSPGAYSISVTAGGFETTVRQASVTIGQITTADIQLSLGAATSTVEVNAQIPLLQTEGGNLSSSINEAQAANIPNPGNDLTYMAQIAPGSTMNTAGGGLGNFSSYGISAVANLFTVNGMDDNDPFLNVNNSGATNLTLGQNEIQEVAVVTNGYSGQYGGLAGANINYITRGGTNSFHGRATWFWNGRKLNANSWFHNASSTPRSFVNANQYGADIGGPIVKDKLFFYANFEGLYLVIPTSGRVLVPSPAFASATQSNIDAVFGANSSIAKFYQTMFSLYTGAPGASRATNILPNTGDCDGSLPAALGFGPNNPCGLGFFTNVSNKTHEHLESYRIDWNVTSRDRFYGRIQKDRGLQASFTDGINPLFNVISDQPEWQGQASETHTFSSGAVNQFTASAQWYSAIFGNANQAATQAAFPTTLQWGSGQFSNLGGIDFNFPQGRRVSQFQLSDDFSKTIGAHTLKAGGKFRRNWVSNTDYSIFSTGLVIPVTQDAFFNGGTDFKNLNLAGTPNLSELLQSFPTALEQPFAIYTLGGYVEDDWKIRSNLTLNLAFRLDHPSNAICFHQCFARPAVDFPTLSTDPTTPYNQLLSVNQSRQLPSLTTVEAQPRLGFAWEPRFMHNTVVRGGAGIFYDAFPGALLDGFSENPPFDPQFTIVSAVTGTNISSPSDANSLFASAAASNAGFQAGFRNGASFATLSSSVPGFSAPNLAASVNHPIVPQYQKWSLEVEHQFGANTSVSVQYVGNHGIHIFTQNSAINACNNTGGFASLPACNPLSNAGVNPSFLNVNYAQSIGVSNYNGMTASFTHRIGTGVVQFNYTYSHALDTVSNSGIPADAFGNVNFGAANNSAVFPENPANPRQFNYASSDYDARHSFNANYVWELPVKRFITRGHGPDRLLRGWDVSGDMFFRTGFPYTLVDGATSTALQGGGYGSSNDAVAVFGTLLQPGGTGANCATTFAGTPGPNDGLCLNPADFKTSKTGFGNVSRNSIRGPKYWNTDFSLMKHTKITERAEFVLGAQFFNVFNHPNFDAPVLDTSSPSFGQVVRTVAPPTTLFGSVLGADASPRLIQLKLQVIF